jgi:hypothetical protein
MCLIHPANPQHHGIPLLHRLDATKAMDIQTQTFATLPGHLAAL